MNRLLDGDFGLRLPPANARSLVLVAGALFVGLALIVWAGPVGGPLRQQTTGANGGGLTSVLPATDGFAGGVIPGAEPGRAVLGAPELATKDASGAQAVASGAPSAPGAAAGGVDLPSLDSVRPVIRTGSVDITVKSVGDAFDQVRLLAVQSGGLVANSSFTGANKQGIAQLTLRVPGDRFGDVVTRLRDMAVEVESISTGSQDVADQLTDLDATLRNLRAVEARYLLLLDQARNIAEILQVQDRVNQVRLQIERTDARRQLINGQVEMATLTVTLRPIGAAGHAPQPATALERVREAWATSLQTLETVATEVLVAVVYSWWMVLMAVAGVLALRRLGRTTPSASSAAAPPPA